MTQVTKRNAQGHFVKGHSGNPDGKAVGTRNQITTLRENTELALREYLTSPKSQKKALKAMDRIFTIATVGDDKQAIAAIKLLFDKILPNARGGADTDIGKQRPLAIVITNQTKEQAGSPITVIEGESVLIE